MKTVFGSQFSLPFFSFKVHRFKRAFAVFAVEAVKRNAIVSQNVLDAKGSFLAALARHNLGAKGDWHFGTRPNARRGNPAAQVFEKIHLYSSVFSFFRCLILRRAGFAFSSGLALPNFRLGGAVGLRIESKTGRSSFFPFFAVIPLETYNRKSGVSSADLTVDIREGNFHYLIEF